MPKRRHLLFRRLCLTWIIVSLLFSYDILIMPDSYATICNQIIISIVMIIVIMILMFPVVNNVVYDEDLW